MGQKILKSPDQKARETMNHVHRFFGGIFSIWGYLSFSENMQKFFREIDLFDFKSFFSLDISKFSSPLSTVI